MRGWLFFEFGQPQKTALPIDVLPSRAGDLTRPRAGKQRQPQPRSGIRTDLSGALGCRDALGRGDKLGLRQKALAKLLTVGSNATGWIVARRPQAERATKVKKRGKDRFRMICASGNIDQGGVKGADVVDGEPRNRNIAERGENEAGKQLRILDLSFWLQLRTDVLGHPPYRQFRDGHFRRRLGLGTCLALFGRIEATPHVRQSLQRQLARWRDAKLWKPAKRSGAPLAVDVRAHREKLGAGRGDPQSKSDNLVVIENAAEPGSILHVGGVGNNRIGKEQTMSQ